MLGVETVVRLYVYFLHSTHRFLKSGKHIPFFQNDKKGVCGHECKVVTTRGLDPCESLQLRGSPGSRLLAVGRCNVSYFWRWNFSRCPLKIKISIHHLYSSFSPVWVQLICWCILIRIKLYCNFRTHVATCTKIAVCCMLYIIIITRLYFVECWCWLCSYFILGVWIKVFLYRKWFLPLKAMECLGQLYSFMWSLNKLLLNRCFGGRLNLNLTFKKKKKVIHLM